ncbi:MAG: M13 family metallopeptidase N-terminal domain-containing protein, partial [Chitinophagales bacterium]
MNKLFHCLAFFSVFLITFTACNQQPKATAEAGCNLDTFLNAYIDSTVRPQDDFFHFSMGKWVKNNPVPASERSWGIWSKVNEENYDRMKNINEEASSKNAEAGTNWQKIGDFWHTGMDTAAIEQQGIQPLSSHLATINALADV